MSTKPWDIYAHAYLGLYGGYPLWIPEPQGREIFMGDVGYLREGQFIPLFNAMKPTDDPVNRSGVPRGFKTLSESRPKLIIRKYPRTFLSSQSTGSMKVEQANAGLLGMAGQADSDPGCLVAGWKFGCTAGPGAFLVTDSHTTTDSIESDLSIRSYMQENLDYWLEFVNGVLQLCLDEQDLVFVSGTMKAWRWAFGASAGKKFHKAEEKYAREKLGCELSEDEGPRFVGHRFPVCHSGGKPAGTSSDVREQCLFINYHKMKRRASGGGPAKGESSPCARDPKREVKPAYRSPDERGYDPVGPVLDYILQNSDVEIAIASEMDVIRLFRHKKRPNSNHLLGAIRRLSPRIWVDENGAGNIVT